MDAEIFFNYRMDFIRKFYDSTASSFFDTKSKIDLGEAPFEHPYSEGDEPPFLAEWLEADESLKVLGQMCVSLLSAALQLYLKEWVKNLHRNYSFKKVATIKDVSKYLNKNKLGWFNGYRTFCAVELSIVWSDGPVNVELLEEIVLARNRVQHPENIAVLPVEFSQKDLTKLRHPFFLDAREVESLREIDSEAISRLIPPIISLSKSRLSDVIEEMKNFVSWLESEQILWGSRS